MINATIKAVNNMNYSNKLRSIRTSELLSQEQVAEYLNINRSTYKEYELQNSIIPSKYLGKLSNILNVSIDYIFNFTEIKRYHDNSNNINKEKSGSRLKEIRKENKLTQTKLATILNTTQSVIADYEKGRYLIATPFLYTICKKYHISADYLLGKIDKIKIPISSK